MADVGALRIFKIMASPLCGPIPRESQCDGWDRRILDAGRILENGHLINNVAFDIISTEEKLQSLKITRVIEKRKIERKDMPYGRIEINFFLPLASEQKGPIWGPSNSTPPVPTPAVEVTAKP